MKTITQKEIENRVSYNNDKYKKEIDTIVKQIKEKGLRKGRMRPKDPNEAKILKNFKK